MVDAMELAALSVTGRLDASSVGEIRSRINQLIETHPTGNVVLDLSGVDLVDATGLGVLAAAHVRLERESRMLILRGCSGTLHRILAVTRLLRVLHVEQVDRRQ